VNKKKGRKGSLYVALNMVEAANDANSTNSVNNGKAADRATSVYVRGN